ncbi:MAG: hypothetical protein WC389_12840 [Lutibacter sp.]
MESNDETCVECGMFNCPNYVCVSCAIVNAVKFGADKDKIIEYYKEKCFGLDASELQDIEEQLKWEI